MELDIGNALGGSPGLTEDTLDHLDERVGIAHERIEQGRAADKHGYAALNLPETVDTDEIRAAVEPFGTPAAVLTVGIGGSAPGAATISAALADPTDGEAHFLDNVDPEGTPQPFPYKPLTLPTKRECRARGVPAD